MDKTQISRIKNVVIMLKKIMGGRRINARWLYALEFITRVPPLFMWFTFNLHKFTKKNDKFISYYCVLVTQFIKQLF